MNTLDFVESAAQRRDLPPFRVGDAVRVHTRVREGEKERIQVFEGLVIRRRGGGAGETFTVRKMSSGVGVERIFPLQSPIVTKVEIKSRGFVRRSRLYYLRDLTGKKARLHSKVRDLSPLISDQESDSRANAAAASDEELTEVVEAAPAENAEEGGKLRGKARKKAKAAEKAVRLKDLAKDAAVRQKAKAEAEAKAAAEAEAESAADAAPEDGGDESAEEKSE